MASLRNVATLVAILTATVSAASAPKHAQPYASGQNGCYYPAETLGSSGCLLQDVTEHGCPFFNNPYCDSKVTWIPDQAPTRPPLHMKKLERRQYDPAGCSYNGPILGSMGCIRNGWDEHGCPQFNNQPECQARVFWYPPGRGASPRPPPANTVYSSPGPATEGPPPAEGTAVVTVTTHSLIYDVQPTTKVITSNVVKSITTTSTAVAHLTSISTIRSIVYDIISTTNHLTAWQTATSTMTIPTIRTLAELKTSTRILNVTKSTTETVPIVTTLPVYNVHTKTSTKTISTTVVVPSYKMATNMSTKTVTMSTTVAVARTAVVSHTTMLTLKTTVVVPRTTVITQTLNTTRTENRVILHSGTAATKTVTKAAVTTTVLKTITATPHPQQPSWSPKTVTVSASHKVTTVDPKGRYATSTTTVLRNVPAVTTITTTKTVTMTHTCTGKVQTTTIRHAPRSDVGGFCNVSFKKSDGSVYWEGNDCRLGETCTEAGWLDGRSIYRGSSCY